MSQFSRRARWLQQLFTPSVAPATKDPTQVSDDVSLVQQYDGGGIAIAESTFPSDPSALGVALEITEPEVAIRDFLTVVGITTITDMVRLSSGLYARILGLSHMRIGGTSGSQFFLDVRPPSGSGVGEHISLLTENIPVTSARRNAIALNYDIIPPGMQINANQIGGDATQQYRWTFNWIVAPIGAIIISTKGGVGSVPI